MIHEPAEVSNIIFFASDSPVAFAIPTDATFETPECEATTRAFQNWEVLKNEPIGVEITDAHNPLAQLQAPRVAAHYEGMKQLLPKEVWVR